MSSQVPSPGTAYWLSGFGGVKIDGVAVWPARVFDESDDGVSAAVLKSKQPGRVLVKSFGDDAFIWAKPQALRALDVRMAESVMGSASTRVKPAIEALLAYVRRRHLQPSSTKHSSASHRAANVVAPALSEYELKRMETIRQNQLVLEALGVATASAAVRDAVTPVKQPLNPAVKAARMHERHQRLLEAQALPAPRAAFTICLISSMHPL